MSDPQTDTPTARPPHRGDAVKSFLGDLARPFAIYSVAAGEAWAIFQGKDAGVITAGGVVLAALYASKTIEVQQAAKHDSQVRVAEVNATATAAAAASPAPAPGTTTTIVTPAAPEPDADPTLFGGPRA